MRKGSGYLGSSKIETSKENQEILPLPPEKWTVGYRLYKMTFKAYDDMTIIINNQSSIFLSANQVFEMDETDALISSFIIVNKGAKFQWIGAYL